MEWNGTEFCKKKRFDGTGNITTKKTVKEGNTGVVITSLVASLMVAKLVVFKNFYSRDPVNGSIQFFWILYL